MFKALQWTTRSLRTHSWPRTQEERQTLETIIDRKGPFPVPLSKAALKRMRQLKAAKSLRVSADTTVPPPEQEHGGKAVGSSNPSPQPDRARSKKWRPTLTQLQVLAAVFQKSPNPSSPLYYELSQRLQAPLKSIIRWFCNRRARGLPSHPKVYIPSYFDLPSFGERPKDPLIGFNPEAKQPYINDRPPVRTLDLSQVTASDFLDLSGFKCPRVPVIVGPKTLTGKPVYETTKLGRYVPFPAGTTGFLYLHSPEDRPAYERSIRFKLVPNIECLEDLHNHGDLLRLNGLPWSIPLWTEDHDLAVFITKAVYDGFVTEEMHRRLSSVANESPRVGRKDSIVIYNMSQVFAVPLDRDRITIWVVTDEMKIRINVRTSFFGEFKRKRDASEAGRAHVSIKPHPVSNAPALVIESIQESRGSPQVKVSTPKYTLLDSVLIERTEYPIGSQTALRT